MSVGSGDLFGDCAIDKQVLPTRSLLVSERRNPLPQQRVRETRCAISSAKAENTQKTPTVGAPWGMYWEHNCNTRPEDDISVR
jgi:hypothetical protein